MIIELQWVNDLAKHLKTNINYKNKERFGIAMHFYLQYDFDTLKQLILSWVNVAARTTKYS